MDGQLHDGVGVAKLLPPLSSESFKEADGQYTDGFGKAVLSGEEEILGEGGPGHDLGSVLREYPCHRRTPY